MTRTRAEEYQRLARECLAMAGTASTGEARAALIERAEGWFRLAEEQDHEGIEEIAPPIAAEESPHVVQQQQQQVQPKDDDKSSAVGAPPMANDDDPNAPYKLYDGDKRIGTHRTRAEARRAQQKLEKEAGSEQRHFTIKDKRERIVS